MTLPIVEASELYKSYGDFQAVNGIDFQITRGECFGILGPNGAGKTTTVAMIYCFLPLSGGRLTVFGKDVAREPRAIKARLGVVPQENNLDLELTVIENLMIYAGYYGIRRPAARTRAETLLNFFGLADRAGYQVEQISGGMKRRLTIARGLIHDPEILILDEPTTGLDPQSRQLIWQHLRHLKKQGLTLILTTHYLEESSSLCDDLMIMDRGGIIEKGSPGELIQKHVGKKVIEVEIPAEFQESFVGSVEKLVNGYQISGDTAFLYISAGEAALVEKINLFGQAKEYRVRPSNLEDVFLKLTGRGLGYENFD